MTTTIVKPTVTALVDGTPVPVDGGFIMLDTGAVPFAYSSITLPLTADTAMDDLDPRAGDRIVINGTTDGTWIPNYTAWTEQRRNLVANSKPATVTGWNTPSAAITADGIQGTITTPATAYMFTDRATEAIAIGDIVTLTVEYRVDAIGANPVTQIKTAPHKRTGNTYYDTAKIVRPIVVGQWETVSIVWVATAAMPALELDLTLISANSSGGATQAGAGFKMTARRVIIERGTADGTYFDGATVPGNAELERYRWTGTANASASVYETRTAEPPTWSPAPGRPFDLGIRHRTIDHVTKTVDVALASDEALLEDYAPLVTDTGARAVSSSLRAVVNYVLGKIGAHLEPGTADADVTPHWTMTNLFPDPSADNPTVQWVGIIAAPNVVRDGNAYGTPWDSAYQVRIQSTGTAAIAVGQKTSMGVRQGNTYTASIYTRASDTSKNGRLIIRWLGPTGNWIGDVRTGYFTEPQGSWRRRTLTAVAPKGATAAQLYLDWSSVFSSGQLLFLDGAMFYEGSEIVDVFSGNTPATADYLHAWTATALEGPSVRTAKNELLPDLFEWLPGISAWNFIEPLCTWAGLRLFCDERRRWYLVDPAVWAIPGSIAIAAFNATGGQDTVTREDGDVFATGVVVKYGWKDPATGDAQLVYDVAGTPEKVATIEYNRAYPGPGAAAAILKRRNGSGRVVEATTITQWAASPGMDTQITLPVAPEQRGKIRSVRFSLGDDSTMDIKTAGLVDIIAGSIDALPGTIDALPGTIDNLKTVSIPTPKISSSSSSTKG